MKKYSYKTKDRALGVGLILATRGEFNTFVHSPKKWVKTDAPPHIVQAAELFVTLCRESAV